jgi:hypothetical protein
MSKVNLDEPELRAVMFAVQNVMHEKAFGTEEQHALYRAALVKLEVQLQRYTERDEVDCCDFERGETSVLSDCGGTGHYLCRACSCFDAEMDTRSGPAAVEKG